MNKFRLQRYLLPIDCSEGLRPVVVVDQLARTRAVDLSREMEDWYEVLLNRALPRPSFHRVCHLLAAL